MDQEPRSAVFCLFILYGDFNCPFCYALHERLHDMTLLDRCEWRGVQHAPHLPTPMAAWHGRLKTELEHEVAVVERLAPGLPIALPAGKPNTRPAIETAIGILRQDRERGMEFVRKVYRAFWCEGLDISDKTVLAELAGGAGNVGSGNRHIAQEWETAWHATGESGVPLIVSPEGEFLVGCVPEESIRRFFA